MTVRTAALPRPGETLIGGDFVMGPGGKGANQAVAARRLGGDAALVCKVGRDMFGDNAILHYEREGLDTRGILVSELPSGVALINVDAKGENCIVVAPGANMDLTEEDIERVSDRIREADIVLLQLEIPIPSVLAAARIAHAGGAQVVLNPAPYAEVPDELFRYVDLFIPNETELSAYTGITVCDRKSALGAADIMLARGVKKIIVTLGSKGSLIYDGKEVCDVAACPVEAVDTTAAGDTFTGYFVGALAEGRSPAEALKRAAAAAAISVTRPGAAPSVPGKEEVEAFLAGK